jgi:hypothetical protein
MRRRLGRDRRAWVLGGCVHFSCIEGRGYRELRAGQRVRFTVEKPGFLQDGCPFRALTLWPENPLFGKPGCSPFAA